MDGKQSVRVEELYILTVSCLTKQIGSEAKLRGLFFMVKQMTNSAVNCTAHLWISVVYSTAFYSMSFEKQQMFLLLKLS